MGKNKTTENRGRNPEKTLEMDWTYTKEAKDKHNPSSHTLESTREKEERKTQEHTEKGRRGRLALFGQTEAGWDAAGERWRLWPRIGLGGELLFVAYTQTLGEKTDDDDDEGGN